MADQIEMPANCAQCGGVWDLNELYGIGGEGLICPPCYRERDAEQRLLFDDEGADDV